MDYNICINLSLLISLQNDATIFQDFNSNLQDKTKFNSPLQSNSSLLLINLMEQKRFLCTEEQLKKTETSNI